MLYFVCHTELVRLTEHLRGTRKSEPTKKSGGFPTLASVQCSVSLRRFGPELLHRFGILVHFERQFLGICVWCSSAGAVGTWSSGPVRRALVAVPVH